MSARMVACWLCDVRYDLPNGTGRMPFVFAKTQKAALAAVQRINPEATNVRINSAQRSRCVPTVLQGA